MTLKGEVYSKGNTGISNLKGIQEVSLYQKEDISPIFQGFAQTVFHIMNIMKIRQALKQGGIDLSKWGNGKTKSVHHLLEELENQESSLIMNDSLVFRELNVCSGEVYYTHEDSSGAMTQYVLREDMQVFKNGDVKHRTRTGSISEKISTHEEPIAGISRALKEELGLVSNNVSFILNEGSEVEIEESSAYPGLLTRYFLYKFKIVLMGDIDVNKGFKEKQKDKTVYFVWERQREDF